MGINFKAFDPTTKTYFKRNYGDAINQIVPTIYTLKDFDLSGTELDQLDLLLKTHLQAANNLDTILPISATLNFSSIDTLSGITPYFIKQNNNTRVTPFYFERDILDPLDFQLEEFETSGEWKAYLETNLLPALTLNNPSAAVYTPKGVTKTLTDAYGVADGSGVHEYLINSLGWFYFLNTSAPDGGSYAPSSYVLEKLTELFTGKNLYILEGIQGFEEYLWKNYLDVNAFQRIGVVPVDFISGTASSTYTSGTQNLDRLNTLLEVLYSPLYADATDFKVKEAFEFFTVHNSFTPEETFAGPFSKLLRVLGYFYQDINSPIEKLEALYDIDNCPEEYLPHLSDLIGWELIGSDPGKWRSQIRNAVRIYKAKGTNFATQLVLRTLFGEHSSFNLSGSMYELYESYIPHIIYYLLATETPFFNQAGYKDNPFDLWTQASALEHGVSAGEGGADWSDIDADSNIRRCVDKILRVLWEENGSNFFLGGGLWPRPGDDNFIFEYRGRDYPIPPFEEIRYYEKVQISYPLLTTLSDELLRFDIDPGVVASTIDYISNISISALDDISIGNRFVLFTSGFELPFNFTEILSDISNKRSSFLSLWNAKSSHFDLHLSSSNFKHSTKAEVSDTSLGITIALKALNKVIPAHAIPRVKLFLEALEYMQASIFACPLPMHTPLDVFTSSTVVNAWELSGLNMQAFIADVGLGHGLSSTNISRPYVNSVADLLMDGDGEYAWDAEEPKVASVPRNNLRRRTFHMSLPRNGYFSRTGFDMPNSYEPSTFDLNTGPSGGGALILGYNYSGCEFQTPFPTGSVSAMHPVWSYCETSSSDHQFFGVDSSSTFHWRGTTSIAEELQGGNCLLNIRREECPEIIRIMHSTIEKDALRDAYEHYKIHDVSDAWVGGGSASWMDPIQSLANSAFNGVASWSDYSDYTFGSGVQKAYNYYAKEFGRQGTAPHLVSGSYDHGGRTIFSHIYGPLLYNGNFTQNGVSSTMVASSFEQEDFSGVTSAVLFDSGASTVQGQASSLVIGRLGLSTANKGEFRYPFALSGIEFCYRSHLPSPTGDALLPVPSFKVYRPATKYIEDSPGIIDILIKEATLVVDTRNHITRLVPRIRFDLSKYGNSSVSGNFFLPEQDLEFNMRIAKIGGFSEYGNVWVWIHTMPENGYFWSWEPQSGWNYDNKYHNGEWVVHSENEVIEEDVAAAYGNVQAMSTRFGVLRANLVTKIIDLEEDNFETLTIKFNTHNKQTRLSSDFKSYPKEYQPAFLHRIDQHYVVEVLFDAPAGGDSQYIIPEVTIIDKTLADSLLDEFTISYTDGTGALHTKTTTRTGIDDYRGIFKFMNTLAATSLGSGFGTRIAADSSGIFETSGGSRLNYRYHPKWDATTRDEFITDTNNYTVVDFKEGS